MKGTGWEKRAACAGHPDPELWFPEHGESSKHEPRVIKAVHVCRRCPVIRECLAAALTEERDTDVRMWHGIRGGLTVKARARYARSRQSTRDGHDVQAVA